MQNIRLIGAYASPYSRKMRAVLRYRRIPFRWILRGSAEDVGIPDVPVALIPVLAWSDVDGEHAMIDSTFQIRRLETVQSGRFLVPDDPVIAFLDALVEDYADEWVTKAMYHYRWAYAADAQKASHVIPCDQNLGLAPDLLARTAASFSERQISRLAVVGSNPETAPLIEASYRRLLTILEEHLQNAPFVFGTRPSAADFALFGQLSQLVAFDPTPAAVAATTAPRVIAWVNRLDDLAWLPDPGPGDWTARPALATTVRPLLDEIGRVYVPFLLANATALAGGADRVTSRIDGATWTQSPFAYQGKCLRWLRERHTQLSAGDREVVDGILAGTGCEPLFARA
jgi:glutathione S-transferase